MAAGLPFMHVANGSLSNMHMPQCTISRVRECSGDKSQIPRYLAIACCAFHMFECLNIVCTLAPG